MACINRCVLSWLLLSATISTLIASCFLQVVNAWDLKLWCHHWECCQEPWLNHNNISGLERAMTKKVFGQHLVHDTVRAALSAHIADQRPHKPLVLSFHGRTGTGKNYVAHIIAESLYRNGMDSNYVHMRTANRDYPHRQKVDEYKKEIKSLIEDNVTKCPHQLFIFDEVEDMPEGLLDIMKPYLDYNSPIRDPAYRKAIFIFLSNIAGSEIMMKTMEHLKSGMNREDIQLKDMEQLIELSAVNTGGFRQSRLIDAYVVSHFVPFLPLEKSHVRDCVRAHLPIRANLDSLVDKVMDLLQFVPKDDELFALKGCKNVVEKVTLVLHKQFRIEL